MSLVKAFLLCNQVCCGVFDDDIVFALDAACATCTIARPLERTPLCLHTASIPSSLQKHFRQLREFRNAHSLFNVVVCEKESGISTVFEDTRPMVVHGSMTRRVASDGAVVVEGGETQLILSPSRESFSVSSHVYSQPQTSLGKRLRLHARQTHSTRLFPFCYEELLSIAFGSDLLAPANELEEIVAYCDHSLDDQAMTLKTVENAALDVHAKFPSIPWHLVSATDDCFSVKNHTSFVLVSWNREFTMRYLPISNVVHTECAVANCSLLTSCCRQFVYATLSDGKTMMFLRDALPLHLYSAAGETLASVMYINVRQCAESMFAFMDTQKFVFERMKAAAPVCERKHPARPLGSTLLYEVECGSGKFRALSDGTIRVLFNEGISCEWIPGKQVFRIVALDGSVYTYTIIDCEYGTCPYRPHIAACKDFREWAFAPNDTERTAVEQRILESTVFCQTVCTELQQESTRILSGMTSEQIAQHLLTSDLCQVPSSLDNVLLETEKLLMRTESVS
eukprot:ANDGO_02253.mRNA.1 hypothetical protein